MEHATILDLVRKTTPPDADEVRKLKGLVRSYVEQNWNSTEADGAFSAIYDAYLNVKMAHIVGDVSMAHDAMKQLLAALSPVERPERKKPAASEEATSE